MKIQEMRELTRDELEKKIDELQRSLFESRMKNGTRQLSNTAILRTIRHQLSQLKTVLTEKDRQEELSHV